MTDFRSPDPSSNVGVLDGSLREAALDDTRVFAILLVRGGAARLPAEFLCLPGVTVGISEVVLEAVLAPFSLGALFGGCGKDPMLTVFLTDRSDAGVVGVLPSSTGDAVVVGMPDAAAAFSLFAA